MSDLDEPGTDDLERRLDAAFQATRPRRGFEDELWARLQRRRPWWRRAGEALRRVPPAGAAAGLAAVVVVGLVVTVLRLAAAPHPNSPSSTTAARASAEAPFGAAAARGGAAQSVLPFGALPAPQAAGSLQVIRPAGPSAVAGGTQRVDVRATISPGPASLDVYRFAAGSGPADGTILDPGQVPAGLTAAPYPARPAAEAVAGATGSGASQAAVLTQARLVYVSVVAGGVGYLEPAYLYTGTSGGAPVQLLVSALAPSALR